MNDVIRQLTDHQLPSAATGVRKGPEPQSWRCSGKTVDTRHTHTHIHTHYVIYEYIYIDIIKKIHQSCYMSINIYMYYIYIKCVGIGSIYIYTLVYPYLYIYIL